MATGDTLGAVERDGDRVTLRFRRDLAVPRARVWRALSHADDLRWWMPVELCGECTAGATLRLRF